MPLWKGNFIQNKPLSLYRQVSLCLFWLNFPLLPSVLCVQQNDVNTNAPPFIRYSTFHIPLPFTLALTLIYWLYFPSGINFERIIQNILFTSNVFVQEINCTQTVLSFKIKRFLHTRQIIVLLWVITEGVVVIFYRCFGTFYRSLFKNFLPIFGAFYRSNLKIFTDVSWQPIGSIFKDQESSLKIGPIGCPETLARNSSIWDR